MPISSDASRILASLYIFASEESFLVCNCSTARIFAIYIIGRAEVAEVSPPLSSQFAEFSLYLRAKRAFWSVQGHSFSI